MEKHLQLLGILHIVYHSLGIIAGVIIVMLFGSLSCLVPDVVAASVLGVIGTVLAIIILGLSIPGLIGGIGVLKRASWSRVLLLIVGVLNIVDIPLGTALGVYTLWVLLSDDATALLSGGGPGSAAVPAPPAAASQSLAG